MSGEFYLTCVSRRKYRCDFSGSRPSVGYAISRENHVIQSLRLLTDVSKLSEILTDWKTFLILLTSPFPTLIVIFVSVVGRTP